MGAPPLNSGKSDPCILICRKKYELSIDGNAALSKLVLVDLSDAGTIDSEVKP